MRRTASYLLAALSWLLAAAHAAADDIDRAWADSNYTKREVMISMRDGVRLYTAVYEPRHARQASPVLYTRTPYGATPYGSRMAPAIWNAWRKYAGQGYIFVVQDVRGRFRSEGTFVNVRPFVDDKRRKTDVDEASDVYDTAEWIVHNARGNKGCNKRIALIGSSYGGFYAMMGALSGHKAVRAAVPEAPVCDWFMGDDYHHNGAFMLTDSFRFCPSMNRLRPQPTESGLPRLQFFDDDEYSFFLREGCISRLTQKLDSTVLFWDDLMAHPDYDEWWQRRDVRRACRNVRPAVLVVGGTFDAEDCFGTWNTYKAIRTQSPQTDVRLAVGPWYHGAWNNSDGSRLGNVMFGQNTTDYYRDYIEFPFLQHYLLDKPEPLPGSKKAHVFFTGEDKWHEFDCWDTDTLPRTTLFMHADGTLSEQRQAGGKPWSEYVSDPAHPVPYTDRITHSRQREYMTDDQRFASRRPDVLCFVTEPLAGDISFGGEVDVDLHVAVSTTDADFVVKVIDCFPNDFKYDEHAYGKGNGSLMAGYQMLVRGDVMRGRYRNSFSKPEPFTPGKAERVRFAMSDIAHTFKAGHRIMIQVQSTWFPLVDRNPQQFVDIYKCSPADFVSSGIRIMHTGGQASSVSFVRRR